MPKITNSIYGLPAKSYTVNSSWKLNVILF